MDLAQALVAYALPAALITMLPGPDTAMVLMTAVKAGRAAAARAALGVGSGLLIWGAAAALGLAAALRSSAVLYDAFRLICAAYLIFLAVQALRSSRRPESDPKSESESGDRATGKRWRLPAFGWGYRRALLTCALNPKLGVFFVVVLPQFVPAGAAVGPTSMALAALHAAEAVLWYLLLGGLAGAASHVLARRRVRVWLDRVTAAVFLGFGVRLAVEASS
jgi:threonine/homoserine/homoserine lactone efflux protein